VPLYIRTFAPGLRDVKSFSDRSCRGRPASVSKSFCATPGRVCQIVLIPASPTALATNSIRKLGENVVLSGFPHSA
jgi:hypothetical protein